MSPFSELIVVSAILATESTERQHDGWKDLGRLMFSWEDGAVPFVHFGEPTVYSLPLEEALSASVITEMTRVAKSPLEANRSIDAYVSNRPDAD